MKLIRQKTEQYKKQIASKPEPVEILKKNRAPEKASVKRCERGERGPNCARMGTVFILYLTH